MNISSVIKPVNIMSSLDSSTSLLPIGVKDAADVTGRTAMGYKEGGIHEAREKLIEESGTSLLWLGGIPLFRKVFDKTLFKMKGLDPSVDLKKLTHKGPQQLTEEGLKKLTNYKGPAEGLFNKYKKANITKTLGSIGISFTLITAVLPKINQNLSRHLIISEAKNKRAKKLAASEIHDNNSKASSKTSNGTNGNVSKLNAQFNANIDLNSKKILTNNNKISFKGNFAQSMGKNFLNMATEAQRNPVGDMIFMDMGISGNRVGFIPRNNQERAEYAIKEGGIMFFFFAAAPLLKKGFEWAAKKLNTPINLDYKILASKEFSKGMADIAKNKTPENMQKVLQFAEKGVKKGTFEERTVNFVKKNLNKPEFLTIDAAKKTGIIKTVGNELNPKKFIESKDLQKLSNDINLFSKKMLKSGLSSEEFINKAKKFKTFSIFANMALCNLALGYALPKVQYVIREKVFGSKEFPGTRAYEEEAQKILAAQELKKKQA